MKTCSRCRKLLEDDLFIWNNKIHSRCKFCKEDWQKYNENNKDKLKQYYKDNKEKLLTYTKQYKLSNPEKIKEFSKQYRLDHQEDLIQYRNNNKEIFKVRSIIYRRRKRGEQDLSKEQISVLQEDIKQKIEKTNYCPVLNILLNKQSKTIQDDSLSIDHIIPNIDEPNNLIVISHKANTIKSNLSIEELKLLSEDNLQVIFNNKSKEEILNAINITSSRFNAIYRKLKASAKNKSQEFNLSKEYVLQILIPRCPIFNIELDYNYTGKYSPGNLKSFDRIDSSKGYIEGNVRVISLKANASKCNATPEEIKKVYAYYKQLF